MDNQNGTSNNSNQETTTLSQWSGDWFVFNNGAIQGPLSAVQAFSLETTDIQGKPLLISKKGFTQWYALQELAEIFKVTEDLGRRVDSEKAAITQQQIITNAIDSRKQKVKASQQAKLAAEPQAKRTENFSSKIVKKQVGPKNHRIVDIRPQADGLQATPSSVVDPVNLKTSPVVTDKSKLSKVIAKNVGPEKVAAKAAKVIAPIAAPAASPYQSPVTATKSQVEPTKKQLLQEYFFIRGRLRLGKIRSPWATAFFGLPFSLGLLWPFWMSSLLKEVFYHSANRTNFPKSVVVMGFIPILHFYGVYRTAQLVREMEMQNRYKSVSPILAATFAIFPPFAMAYLQDAANRHWLLHARHVQAPKK
jgi:hypothetical protein